MRGATVTITRVDDAAWSEVTTTDRKGRFLREGEKALVAQVDKDGYLSTRGHIKPVVLSSEQGSGGSRMRQAEATFEVDFRLRRSEPSPAELEAGEVEPDIRIIAAQKAYNRGVSAARSGQLDKAIREFELTLLADPGHRSAPYSIGKIRFDQKRFADAAVVFERLAAEPDADAELLELTFHSLKQDSRYLDALAFLDRLWRLEPAAAHDELLEMAALYDTAGDAARARELVEKLLETDPDNPTAHYVHGRTLTSLGEPAAAVRQFERFLELAPESDEAERVRARLESLREEAGREEP
ncbi:MAG: tetratricopeptide repeat protein [Acidobacteriota bacterium]